MGLGTSRIGMILDSWRQRKPVLMCLVTRQYEGKKATDGADFYPNPEAFFTGNLKIDQLQEMIGELNVACDEMEVGNGVSTARFRSRDMLVHLEHPVRMQDYKKRMNSETWWRRAWKSIAELGNDVLRRV